MRKITSKHYEKKRQKRNQIIVGTVLVSLMVLSTLGYSFMNHSEANTEAKEITYNGYEFISQDGFWSTQISDFNFVFKNNPLEIEQIKTGIRGIDNYRGKPLYIYSEDIESEYEIYRNLNPQNNNIVQRIQKACLKNETCEGDVPIKDCKDNFIIIKESNETKLYQMENCVFIEAPSENITQTTDEFLFNILGIRKT